MNPKIEELRKEKAMNEDKIAGYEQKDKQLSHQLELEENRQRFLSKKERSGRTHHLCNLGGTVEHFFPVTARLTRDEMYTVFEMLSELPEVQTLFRSVHPRNGGE